MADDITIDIDELHQLTAHLGRVAGRMLNEVDDVVKKAAQNVKDQMVEDAQGSRHFSAVAPSISYDRHYRLGQVGYDVGPDKDVRGGALANIAYFGGVNGGGGTLDVDKPLRAEEPNLLRALGDLGDLI